ncbi:required for meiotic nuclear division protein 1 homolog [Anabrus simplex]|uniref:required for meiotic nuclear division protein 1 homolog n=1 Tax=Anabrus simplex TaxID=316456 RepID=UPI0034DCF813
MIPIVVSRWTFCKSNFVSCVKHLHSASNFGVVPLGLETKVLLQCRLTANACRTFNVPPTLLDIGNGRTFSGLFNIATTGIFQQHCVRSLSTKTSQGIQEKISSLQMKKRPLRKKRPTAGEEDDGIKPGFWNVTAYATAEEYDLEKLLTSIQQQELYNARKLTNCPELGPATVNDLDVVYATARYPVGDEPREIFFFREGSAVFWNMTELECNNVLVFLRAFEQNSYDERLVQEECDIMPYSYSDTGQSHLADGSIFLAPEQTTLLDKYTFSNAMALSVKLGIWEASLDRYVDSIEFIVEDLKRGNKIKISQEEVLRKTGELFALRHLINLSSDLLDTPDFYWDRETQEALYQQTCSYFSIQRRTRVMNEKLNHCVELVELLSSHLSDRHHIRLEWMIIVLIMVEVGFEILHYVERYL